MALQKSVSTASVAQATFAATLVDEWSREGLRDVVICPGSRSTPLTLAFANRDEFTLHVRIDERSAAFFALGRALATRRPVPIVVTSGTAAAEVHAAVAEADLAHVPLLVLTADRPPELHGVGAPQAIDQRNLYGSMVRLYEEPGVTRADAAYSWRPLAQRLLVAARGDAGTAGPVHLNAAFVEPLLAEPDELPPRRGVDRSPRDGPARRAEDLDVRGRRVLAVVGAGASRELISDMRAAQWVVIGDATAQGTLPYGDPLVRHDAVWKILRPEVIVRVGGIPASKFLAQRLRSSSIEVIALDAAGPVADPDGVVTSRMTGWPDATNARHVGDASYVELWREASGGLEKHLASWWSEELDEILVARVAVEMTNAHGASLVVGSSMPVRDVEWWCAPRDNATFANRGANGIDGVVSTFLGVAYGASAIGLVGDVTMLHDVSALVDGAGPDTRAVLVVSDNGGGGIFSFLDHARDLASQQFETLFATSRPHDLAAVATAFGHHGERVTSATQLRTAIEHGIEREGLSVVVAQVPTRDANVARHEELNSLVAQWWTSR